ncbi:MAG: Universal stress protein family protein [Nitrososphaeraceae archaeon]|jgi:nucleotide-binding universal stress UspA family protein|nr:Universal stress protein family protein [Nitrososphaeraceae archaeon]
MNSSNDVNITNPSSSSSYSNVREDDYSKESSNNYSISKSNIPSYTKILVPHDGKEMSDKALSHAVYLSNLSGAEIVILRIIEDVDKLGDTSVNVSQNNKAIDNQKGFEHNIQGELVNAMEQKIKKCVEAGSKNKISFEIKAGHVVDEIVKADEDNYDLIVMTTSHLDSWVRSLFSETRKIISNINTPVLIIH